MREEKIKIMGILVDITLAVLIVLAVWIVDYRMPQSGGKEAAFSWTEIKTTTLPQAEIRTASFPQTEIKATALSQDNVRDAGIQDWHEKFADKFTDSVVVMDTSYRSPNLSIQLSYHHYDSGILDWSESGKHKKYGTQVSYVLADIYVGDITCLQTAFAKGTYGVGYSQKLSDMSSAMKAVLSVNGDSYSNNRHKNNGIIIRNGVVYRDRPTNAETCVLNRDGTMDIYRPDQISLQKLEEKGAYQTWIFGPSLLDENGKAKESFLTWDYIKESHPRTAIGYYEPGHYCLLLADGRQKNARGMFLEEMAAVFEELGCRAAYNLDGGHCSFMMFKDRTANHPYKPEHEVTDGIFFRDV